MTPSSLNGPALKKAYNERFLEFIRVFGDLAKNEKLFPKACRACGRTYEGFPEYIHATRPVGHALEDISDIMEVPHTMQYRNCACGSTLILSFTEETYPLLRRFWEMLRSEAAATGRSLREVTADFRDQCNQYVIEGRLAEEKDPD